MAERTELLERAAGGDQAAWVKLWDRYESKLTTHTLMLLAGYVKRGVSAEWRRQLAAEIAHSAFAEASSYLSPEKIPFWTAFLKGFTKNETRDRLHEELKAWTEFAREHETARRQRRGLPSLGEDEAAPEQDEATSRLRDLVIGAIQELPVGVRTVAQLRWKRGLSTPEIAKRVNLSRQKVDRALIRAEAMVISSIQPHLGEISQKALEALRKRRELLLEKTGK